MTEVSTALLSEASTESGIDEFGEFALHRSRQHPRPGLFTRGEVTAAGHPVVPGDPDAIGFWEVDFGEHITVSMYVEVHGDVAHIGYPTVGDAPLRQI